MKNFKVPRGVKAKSALKSPRDPYHKIDEKRFKPGLVRKKRETAASKRKQCFSRQRPRGVELIARRHHGDANA